MRRVIKYPNSKILEDNLQYIEGNTRNNRKIAEQLFEEQKRFCAYTDQYISRTDAADIEHFNPSLKGEGVDNYDNWFLVKHQWNKEKSYKWDIYQPVLHPTASDFEERILYKDGDYIAAENDDEAKHLIQLLKLDDPLLAEDRKRYVKRKREEIAAFNQDADLFFSTLINNDPSRVHFLRAIKEEFGIDVWEML